MKLLDSTVIILLLEEKLLSTEAAPEFLKDISSKEKEPGTGIFPEVMFAGLEFGLQSIYI